MKSDIKYYLYVKLIVANANQKILKSRSSAMFFRNFSLAIPYYMRQFNFNAFLSSKNGDHAHYRSLVVFQHSGCFELLKSFCILECQNPAMAEECLALASEVRFRILPDQNCTVLSNEILTLIYIFVSCANAVVALAYA